MSVIFVLCAVGSFAINGRLFDIYLMFIFGLIGFYMRENNFPAAPLVLGFILGPMADENFRRAMVIADANLTPFFTRCLLYTSHPEATMEEVGQAMLRYGHGGLPVLDDGCLVGIISRRDVDKSIHHGLAHACLLYTSRCV